MNIKKTFLYKDILSKNLGSEFNANLEWELERVENSGVFIKFEVDLVKAFFWKNTPQGMDFWEKVSWGRLPKEYL